MLGIYGSAFNLAWWLGASLLSIVVLGTAPLLISAVWCAVHALTFLFRRRLFFALSPIALNAAGVALFLTPIMSDVLMHLDYSINRSARQQVVSMIGTRQLEPKPSPDWDGWGRQFVPLPDHLRYLSKDHGEVMVYNRFGAMHILFFPVNDFFFDYRGFLYRSDGGMPSRPGPDVYDDWIQYDRTIRLDEHWFWIEHKG